MPFTFSHPAAVVPLARSLPASALIIGSIVPDLGYYVPLPWDALWMHTPAGSVKADLACGIAAYALWWWVVVPAGAEILPAAWRRRITTSRPQLGARRMIAVVTALYVGTLTHIVWDAMTHDWMWGPAHLPWLNRQWGPLPIYDWLQSISSVGGLVIVFLWWRTWWKRPPSPEPIAGALPVRTRCLSWTVIATSAICGCVSGVATADEGRLVDIAFTAYTRGITGMLVGFAMVCAALWLRRWSMAARERATMED